MITCKNCHAYASPVSIRWNKWMEEVGKLTIKPCKRCGLEEGDYDDFEEIDRMFELQDFAPKEKENPNSQTQ